MKTNEELADIVCKGLIDIVCAARECGLDSAIIIRELLTVAAMHHISNFETDTEESFKNVASKCWKLMNETKPGSPRYEANKKARN